MKPSTLYNGIVAIILFITIMTVIMKTEIGKNVMYYILWLTVITTLLVHSKQISDLLSPITKIGAKTNGNSSSNN